MRRDKSIIITFVPYANCTFSCVDTITMYKFTPEVLIMSFY